MEEEQVEATEEAAEVEEQEEATASETEETEETADDSGADPEPPKARGVQKRIDELVKQREDERRRAERLEGMLEQMLLKQQSAEEEPPPPTPQPTRAKPTLEGCEYDQERYTEELTDWKIEQREAAQRTARQREDESRQQQAQSQTFAEKRDATVQAGEAKYPDFRDVVFTLPGDVMHPQLAAAVFETASPADVAYYLGKNPAEAARLAKLPPIQMAMELARAEAKATVKPPPKKTTAAPPPVNPVGAKATADVEPDPGKDPEGWRRWEQARVRKLGRLY